MFKFSFNSSYMFRSNVIPVMFPSKTARNNQTNKMKAPKRVNSKPGKMESSKEKISFNTWKMVRSDEVD